MYALVFLVAHCQGRTGYPAEGWSNSQYIFTDSDLEVGLEHLGMVMGKQGDAINFNALYFLLRECNLLQRINDTHDRNLLTLIIYRSKISREKKVGSLGP